MSTSKTKSNADKLRELIGVGAGLSPSDPGETFRARHKLDDAPRIDDLVQLIRAVENVNQHVVFENKYLKEEAAAVKVHVLKLIEENTRLHKELKGVTVLEMLAELEQQQLQQQQQQGDEANVNQSLHNEIKNKEQELQQSQLIIQELQKQLQQTSTNPNHYNQKGPPHAAPTASTTGKKGSLGATAAAALGVGGSDTLENMDSYPICCTKCTEELEIKLRQIENLRNDNEQLARSKEHLSGKLDEAEMRELDLLAQLKRHDDLVKHLEFEKKKAVDEKEQACEDRQSAEQKLRSVLLEFDAKISEEKEYVVSNMEARLGSINDQNKALEERLFKHENLIDRLTRDKVTLTSELETYKNKCSSLDLDAHQMSERLRNKYMEVLKERDVLLYDNKRIRHDYELYVRQNDQDKFCLRDELNVTRERLGNVERDMLAAKEECIKLTERGNQLDERLLSAQHAHSSLESSRNQQVRALSDKLEERERQLLEVADTLKARFVGTCGELESLVEMQKSLIDKLKAECATLNEQLAATSRKHVDEATHASALRDQLNARLKRNQERVAELDAEALKHNRLHERMRETLAQMGTRIDELEKKLSASETNESLLKANNIHLVQEMGALKRQLTMLTMPTRQQPQQQQQTHASANSYRFSSMTNTSSNNVYPNLYKPSQTGF